MNTKSAAWVAAIVLSSAGALAGCAASDAGEPSPSPSASVGVDLSPGVFDLDEARAAMGGLSASEPFGWHVNSATKYPAQGVDTNVDVYSEPPGCTVFSTIWFLEFTDDALRVPDDAIFDSTYVEEGTDDPLGRTVLADVRLRVLGRNSRAATDITDALTAASDRCVGGYRVYDTNLGWTMQDIRSMEPLSAILGVPEGATIAGFLVHHAEGEAFTDPERPDEILIWAAFENVAIRISHSAEANVDGSDQEFTEGLLRDVLNALADSGAAD